MVMIAIAAEVAVNPSWKYLESWYLSKSSRQIVKVYNQGRVMKGLLLLLDHRGQIRRVFVKETWKEDFLIKYVQGFAIDMAVFRDLRIRAVSLLAFRYHRSEDTHCNYGCPADVIWFLSSMETWFEKGVRVDFVEERIGLPVKAMTEVSRN